MHSEDLIFQPFVHYFCTTSESATGMYAMPMQGALLPEMEVHQISGIATPLLLVWIVLCCYDSKALLFQHKQM